MAVGWKPGVSSATSLCSVWIPWKWVTTCKKTVGYVLNVTAIQLPW